jgi:hypothetical protein
MESASTTSVEATTTATMPAAALSPGVRAGSKERDRKRQ